MATTAFYSPAHRVLGRLPAADGGFPPNAAPSADFCGNAVLDHRLRYNSASSVTGFGTLGMLSSPAYVLDTTPAIIALANIAPAIGATSGTPLPLVTTTGAGITVLTAATPTTFWPARTILTAGAVIDLIPAPVSFGDTFKSGVYDRTKMGSRVISITGGAAAVGGIFLVSGYDVYGYPMTESITAGAGAVTTNGKKAWKVITSVTPQFSDAGHTYSVGTTDIFGLPLRVAKFGDIGIVWNNANITAATGFLAADATSPATATTGDVRGTYTLQASPSDGIKTLQVRIYPNLGLMAANFTTGLFGVAQYTP